jgi:hypothetical protein
VPRAHTPTPAVGVCCRFPGKTDWANGRVFPGAHPALTVDLPVSSGEIVLYVGMAPAANTWSDYVPFTLATAVRSPLTSLE